MNNYYSKEKFKEMREREGWRAQQCYNCCLHILYMRKQREERKENSRQEVRKERKRERSLSLKKTFK